MYKIVGGDQKEYGPATSDQVREWIATGRANGQTLASFEGSPWKPLSTFPEFADALRVATPPPLPPGGATYPTAGYSAGQKESVISWIGLVLSVPCCNPLFLIGGILCVFGLLQIQKNPQLYKTPKAVPIIGLVLAAVTLLLNIIAIATGTFGEILRQMQR
ncbi:MAG TPA: DUF4339 domain-containing protein [Candidatus Kapabacteria bacterium]|jgi:hypothetical protein|nr:DUF4339 domain-containing protein [Candidatus Kapabacteria bacterium]